MPHIELLDQITIDKIAAGEVVERPASVVKELVENAIDAGASAVVVEIEDGGIALMRISDNGCGIEQSEVRSAFLRHSTSKIRSAEDLAHVASLGFRGEALSSISAVAQVELITKTREALFGTKYVIEGGKEKKLEEVGAPDGTSFFVRQLFYNTPARRKFLKTPMTEAGHISDLLTRLALSHPEISIEFINNRQSKLHTSGNGQMKDAIYHIYGREIANNLLPLEFERNGIKIEGFLGKPVISRGNRNFENYFVNGRYVRSNILSKAIEDAYHDYTMQHKYPFTAFHIHVEQEKIDVNVHPSKMELRFSNQQEVYNLVYEAVREALKEKPLILEVDVPEPKMDIKPVQNSKSKSESKPELKSGLQSEPKPELKSEQKTSVQFASTVRESSDVYGNAEPLSEKQVTTSDKAESSYGEPQSEEDKRLNYFMEKMRERVTSYHNQNSQAEVLDKREIFDKALQLDKVKKAVEERKMREKTEYTPQKTERTLEKERPEEEKTEQLTLFDEEILKKDVRQEYRIVGQVFETYWIIEFHNSMYIIDQHAAHERVLYEKTIAGMKNREYTSQYLSPPIVLSLSLQEINVLETYKDKFTAIGFEIEPFGGDEYAVRAVPANLFSIAKKELLLDMIDSLSDGISSNTELNVIDEKIASMSCKAAVKGNNKLSYAEVDNLIGELLTLENPYHCPHGRPTIISMTKRELEKKFKRIV